MGRRDSYIYQDVLLPPPSRATMFLAVCRSVIIPVMDRVSAAARKLLIHVQAISTPTPEPRMHVPDGRLASSPAGVSDIKPYSRQHGGIIRGATDPNIP